MKLQHLLSGVLFGAVALPAAAVTFDFSNLGSTVPTSSVTCSSTDRCPLTLGGGLTFVGGVSGISVTAVGSYLGNPAATVQDAPSGGPAGLGVYHLITYPAGGGAPIVGNTSDDNVSLGETLTLTFNQAVAFSNITFRNGDHGTSFAGDFRLSIDGGATVDYDLAHLFGTPLYGTTFAFTGLDNPENTKFYVSAMTVTPVPEPETYALMLAGLGMMGALARRRSRKAARPL